MRAQNHISPGIGLIKTIKCSQLFEINLESVWCEGIKSGAGKQLKGGAVGREACCRREAQARVKCVHLILGRKEGIKEKHKDSLGKDRKAKTALHSLCPHQAISVLLLD